MNRRVLTVAPAALLLLAGCVSVQGVDEVLANAAREPLTSQIFAADGSLLASLHAEVDRVPIALAGIPVTLRDAVVSIEDARFYSHTGVDLRAVLRALARDAQTGEVVEGGSTITQQLVKNLLPDPEKTVKRKLHEALLAHQLEQRFSKNEILERYLNTVYFGHGAYGVATAARTYFGVTPAHLSLPQAALLAGLIAAPSRYDPTIDPSQARARRDMVLTRMRVLRKITPAAERGAKASPLGLKPAASNEAVRAPYFVDYVKGQIADNDAYASLGATLQERENALFKGGLRIYTTLDPRLQAAAENSVRSVLPKRVDPSSALVAMRPDGAVVAMVGGRNYLDARDPAARFNIATQGRRQAGSAFKVFTLLAALERGIPLDATYPAPSRITLAMPDGTAWPVHNNEGTSFGGRLSLKRATALSVNVVYAQVLREVGAGAVVDVARRMGITSPLEAVPSIALGSQSVSPLEMANAYATLAANGKHAGPRIISRITDANGKLLWKPPARTTQAVSPLAAVQATDALQEVMRSGTGAHLRAGFPVAGKSGTTDEFRDAWFAGYSPRLATAVWVGFPAGEISMRPPRTRIRVYGASWPGEIWKSFMLAAHAGLPALDFRATADVAVRVRVDTLRECLPNAFTPAFLIEERTYTKGTEPTRNCTEPSSNVVEHVPGVLGRQPAQAGDELRRAGLQPVIAHRYCPDFSPGTVCAQDPAPGSRASVGSHATLWISDDDAVDDVPMVLSYGRTRAVQTLRAAGFEVSVVMEPNRDGPAGCRAPNTFGSGLVWLQAPCAGQSYGRGATVTIYVNP